MNELVKKLLHYFILIGKMWEIIFVVVVGVVVMFIYAEIAQVTEPDTTLWMMLIMILWIKFTKYIEVLKFIREDS